MSVEWGIERRAFAIEHAQLSMYAGIGDACRGGSAGDKSPKIEGLIYGHKQSLSVTLFRVRSHAVKNNRPPEGGLLTNFV